LDSSTEGALQMSLSALLFFSEFIELKFVFRTDFYKVKSHAEEAVGFVPGEALKVTLKIFKQYQDLEEHTQKLSQIKRFKFIKFIHKPEIINY